MDGQTGTAPGAARLDLTPRPLALSVDELVAGATHRKAFRTSDAKSGSGFERLVIDGESYVLKTMHVDDDWIARSVGDMTCRPVTVWASGLLDAVPASIDHAVMGAATGLGRHGWGGALLMRDVGSRLVPPGDTIIPLGQHAAFIADLAALSARFWAWRDTIGLLPASIRWTFFGPDMLEVERGRGWPDAVPEMADRGWHEFAVRAPADVVTLVADLRNAPWAISEAVAATPSTLLHGDWKLGNVGSHADGRTILIDWAYPGEGPACHDLAWYLAINRVRLPESKEDTIARFRADLERNGIGTAGWWDRQLGLCLLGAAVQFGWEKALGDTDELGWWADRAREGGAWL